MRRTLPTGLLALLFALALWVPGCATLPTSGGGLPVRGVLGTDPSGELTLDTQGQLRVLSGPDEILAQLERLPGAVVDLRGGATPTRMRVRDFEIVDPGDGLRPLVGWIIVDQIGVYLQDSVTGTRLALRGEALAALKAQHRARVWVTGSIVGPQVFLIAHWGLLLPPTPLESP